MVEEMYMEEVKDPERSRPGDKANDDSAAPKSDGATELKSVSVEDNGNHSFSSADNDLPIDQDAALTQPDSMSPTGADNRGRRSSGFSFIGSSELDGITRGAGAKKPRNALDVLLSSTNDPTSLHVEPNNHGEPVMIEFANKAHIHSCHGYPLLGAGPENSMGGFRKHPISEIGGFGMEQRFAASFHSNGVSLTLGLQHSDNLTVTGAAAVAARRRVNVGEELGEAAAGSLMVRASASSGGTNVQSRKRAEQLLPDYVT